MSVGINYGDGYSGCVDAQQQYWIKDFLLYDSDKKILESRTSWINASIIDASQTLLAHKFKCWMRVQHELLYTKKMICSDSVR